MMAAIRQGGFGGWFELVSHEDDVGLVPVDVASLALGLPAFTVAAERLIAQSLVEAAGPRVRQFDREPSDRDTSPSDPLFKGCDEVCPKTDTLEGRVGGELPHHPRSSGILIVDAAYGNGLPGLCS